MELTSSNHHTLLDTLLHKLTLSGTGFQPVCVQEHPEVIRRRPHRPSPPGRPLQNCRTAPDATGCHPEPPLRRPERSERGPPVYEVEGSRTGDELARSPEDQRDEGSSALKRTRYRVREALLRFACGNNATRRATL